jgi:TetR/AcrR family transcriptional regulator
MVKSASVVRKPTKRREQQRAIDTRQAILEAALSEFAEKGFEAASIRSIGERTGFQHPLITYHFQTKDLLWRAVAELVFSRVKDDWDAAGLPDPTLDPLGRLRAEYRAFLTFTMAYPSFHHFMLRENRPGSPRLPWLTETYLLPLMGRILPHIEASQAAGLLPKVDPVFFHYLMIGIISVPSSLGAEMKIAKGISTSDPAVVDQYWQLIDDLIFTRLPEPGGASKSKTQAGGSQGSAKKLKGGKVRPFESEQTSEGVAED